MPRGPEHYFSGVWKGNARETRPPNEAPPPYQAGDRKLESQSDHMRMFRGTFRTGNREIETFGTYDGREKAIIHFEDGPARSPTPLGAPQAGALINPASKPEFGRTGLERQTRPTQLAEPPDQARWKSPWMHGEETRWLEDRMALEQRLENERNTNKKLREWIVKERRDMLREIAAREQERREKDRYMAENAVLREQNERLSEQLAECRIFEEDEEM
ncbi:hypothetical protein PRK78_003712 [Emydomyces testavorans]|uniref:Uncharacterized protein n=1 Tax=Emydomyces testavorans TaxID=2070801 RepID=A0AAF0IKV5_9EURO|nr:hypothetical protein PRK78_003712 [Emydomyces testavorans]